MKKMVAMFAQCMLIVSACMAAPSDKFNPLIAPGTLAESSVSLLWDKQCSKKDMVYTISLNGKVIATTGQTNYTFTRLSPVTSYVARISCQEAGNKTLKHEATIRFKTPAKGKTFNITDYGAKEDTGFDNTHAIQAAIDACSAGGMVYIPKGIFMSGALYLKSNMTLYIEKEGVLKGIAAPEAYLPMLLNRFEGWEMNTYASLLNAGTLKRDGTYNTENLRITGSGTIMGGGKKLGEAMIKTSGIRSRGRLICLMNCRNISISGLTITEPPCWTIHYIYSNNITCHGLKIITTNIRNGDGIDPDSSTDSYIFNCTFDTGDDCIAIKSGKNPEGFFAAKPTTNVRITDCDFIRGHGISIGSEMSGGVSGVLVRDCKAGALLHGMQIKGTKERGGYVKNVTVTDCQLQQITVFSALNYNNDGEAAPVLPVFENFVFKNIDLSGASLKEPVINLNGFKDKAHRLRKVTLSHIIVPDGAKIVVNDAEQISFADVQSAGGPKPQYMVADSEAISY